MTVQKFNQDFLIKKGFLKQKQLTDTIIKGSKIIIDSENQLAFASVKDKNTAQELYRDMKYKYGLDFYWFSYNNDQSVVVYKRYGENNYFTYDPRHSQTKSRISKISKVENIDKKGLRSIFNNQDLVEKFYHDLWNLRENISDNIQNDFSIKDKLFIAQKYIDRFIFINFLVQKKLIAKYKNNNYKAFPLIMFLKNKYNENKKSFSKYLKRLFDLLDHPGETYTLDVDGKEFEIYVPHIDGGLFDSDSQVSGVFEKDFVFNDSKIEWEDLLNLFGDYNWLITIEDVKFDDVDLYDESKENITPEILGHIYEKFAISLEKFAKDFDKRDKKEVKAKINEARKGKGVYYTPEEITLYISKNTIWPYVKDKIKAKEETFEEFLEKNKSDKTMLEASFEALRNIKICDPACGSGAFLLQAAELLYVWEKRMVKQLNSKISDFELKKNIVLKNIYGVDIQPGSVEIAKLRLWLWFSSEQEVGNVKQLPNLEYNIMEGNSLIGFTSLDAKFKESNKQLLENITKIEALKKEYKEGTTQKKKKIKKLLQKEIKELRKKVDDLYILYLNYKYKKGKKNLIISKPSQKYLFDNGGKEVKKKKGTFYKEEFYNLKPFHWAVEFYDIFKKGGFDVVIGNPPYFSTDLKHKRLTEIEIELLKSFDTFQGQADYLVYFYEKGYNLIKDIGILGYISKNRWNNAKTYKPFCNFLVNKNLKIIDFDELFVFKGVGTTANIIFIQKGKKYDISYFIKEDDDLDTMLDVNTYLKVKPTLFKKEQDWVLLETEITNYIKQTFKCLIDAGSGHKLTPSNYYKLEYNNGYYIPEDSRLNNFKFNDKDIDFIFPYTSSGDIRKYGLINKDRYIIYISPEKEFKDLSENLKRYFTYLKNTFKLKSDSFFKYHNGCGFRNTSLIEKKIKIIFLNRMYLDRKSSFYLSKSKHVIGMDCSAVKNNSISENYLTVFLNTNLAWYFFRHNFKRYAKRQSADMSKVPICLNFKEDIYKNILNISQFTFQKDFFEYFFKVSNYLIYELYFEEKLKEKGSYQNLNSKVEKLLEPINYDDWIKLEFKQDLTDKEKKEKEKIEQENNKIIEKVYKKLDTKEIHKAIEEMNKFEWIKTIEEEIKD